MAQLESFFWGIIAAAGALVIEVIFFIVISPYADPTGMVSFSHFFSIPKFIIAAACIEEIFKYAIILRRLKTPPLEKSGLLNSLLVGLGFFVFELVLILITRTSPSPQFLAEIAIIHIGTAGLIGYIITAKNARGVAAFMYAMAVAVAFHATYNLLSLKRDYLNNYLVFFILGALVAVNIANFFRIKRSFR